MGRLERAVCEPPDGPLGRDRRARPGRRVATSGRSRRPGSARAAVIAPRRRPVAAAVSRPGSATWASVRKPPSVSSTAANGASPSGIRARRRRRGELGRGGRVERSAERRGQEARDGAPIAGVLVQPRVLAAGDDERLDRRRVRVAGPCRAGRRGRVGPGGSAARPCRRRHGRAGPGPRSGRSRAVGADRRRRRGRAAGRRRAS